MHRVQPIFTLIVLVAIANLVRTIFVEVPVWQHSIGAYLGKAFKVE